MTGRELLSRRLGRLRLVTVGPELVLSAGTGAVFVEPEDARALRDALSGWLGDGEDLSEKFEADGCARPGCGHFRRVHTVYGCTAPHGSYRCPCPAFLP